MASERGGLTPHRRQHWSVEPAAQPATPRDDLPSPNGLTPAPLSPEQTRVEAKRLLWRDSAIILVGIVLALLVAQFLPALTPGLVADETAAASGLGSGATAAPGSSTAIDATLGPVVDPSLGIDEPQPPGPPITLPPTGTFEPVQTGGPTPRPTKRPIATIGPPTPAPTPEPTEEPTPPPTEPPPTEPPPPTDVPTEEPPQPT